MAALLARAAALPSVEKAALESKIVILRKMIGFARSVPDAWNEHQALANTTKGFAVHALNLDVDIGPYLQTQKLMDSVVFARRKGFAETLTAAELEMMNFTGDGNGFDMIPPCRSSGATACRPRISFQRGGYRDDQVAAKHNNVVGELTATDAHMDRESKFPGLQRACGGFALTLIADRSMDEEREFKVGDFQILRTTRGSPSTRCKLAASPSCQTTSAIQFSEAPLRRCGAHLRNQGPRRYSFNAMVGNADIQRELHICGQLGRDIVAAITAPKTTIYH